MRILFISNSRQPDYLCDMLFHGLRQLVGPDVVDVNRLWFMYRSEFEDGRHDKAKLYGRGFSVYGLLRDDDGVDRSDIESKIRAQLFDLIVFGSIMRSRAMISLVLDNYPPGRIVFVDGEDQQDVFRPLLGRGIYFKRELVDACEWIRPIQFAIPEERIGAVKRDKVKIEAFINPRDPSTYIYQNEADYYGDYAESLFGVTMKKAGWDCLRHYEIMANSCIPNFLDVENCPPMTMVFLPKFELWSAKELLLVRGPGFFDAPDGRASWLELHRKIDAVFRRHCTTVALAKYVLDVVSLSK